MLSCTDYTPEKDRAAYLSVASQTEEEGWAAGGPG